MNSSARGVRSHSAGSEVIVVLLGLLLTACAQNPDIRMGDDNTSGTTAKSPPAYLGCVKGELPAHAKTYMQEDNNSIKLFLDSTDPNQAGGLVEVRNTGKDRQFSAYQRDAWYDHGRLLEAALMCSRA